jgi:hypothetical protein
MEDDVLKVDDSCDCDASFDVSQLVLEDIMTMDSHLMAETRGNAGSAHNIVRHSAARQFNTTDPIEGATVEKILKTG